jgi:predicted TIM-barrel fold metal-dependent hydrolase
LWGFKLFRRLIIDSHQHVFWIGRDDAGLVADMDAQGIDLAWLLTWDMAPGETRPGYDCTTSPVNLHPNGESRGLTLREMLIARDRYPKRFILGYCPNPSIPSAPDLLRAAHEIHGVRVCGEWAHRMVLDDPRAIEMFRVAGELKMPVVLDMNDPWLPGKDGKPVYQPLWTAGTLDHLERALQVCPETVFVGHAPGFWRGISADAASETAVYPAGPVRAPGRVHQLLDRYPNLRADLSAGSGLGALKRDPGHARQFLQTYTDRLLFGRDQYGGGLLDFLRGLNMPSEIMDKILYRNARGLLEPA